MERGIYVDGPITMLPGSRLAPTDSERHNAAVEIKTILEGNEKKKCIELTGAQQIPELKFVVKYFGYLSNVPSSQIWQEFCSLKAHIQIAKLSCKCGIKPKIINIAKGTTNLRVEFISQVQT